MTGKDELLDYYAQYREGTAYIPTDLVEGRPHAYAAFLSGDCLSPTLNDGDMVLVDPDKEPAPGDYVVLGRDGWQSRAARLVERGECPLLADGHHPAPYRVTGETILGVIVCAIRPEAVIGGGGVNAGC